MLEKRRFIPCDKKLIKSNSSNHQHHLKEIDSRCRSFSPNRQYVFLNRGKQEYKIEERYTEIERDNNNLL